MAISKIVPTPLRSDVVFIGGSPSGTDEEMFRDFGLNVMSYEATAFNDQVNLSNITAVVITQNARSPSTVKTLLKKHGGRLLDFDCRIIIRPADIFDENGRGIARAELLKFLARLDLPTKGLTPEESQAFQHLEPNPPDQHSPFVRIIHRASKWKAVAKEIIMDPANRAPRTNLEFEGEKPQNGSDELLLRRAFWDCSSIHMESLLGGQSGENVYVYRAYPEWESQQVHGKNSPSLPYLVKIGPRKDIQSEYFKYPLSVKQSISFHLAPHLDADRSCLGADRGLLVGSFVEESETLLDRAKSGRNGPAIIAGLFNRTLSGWHRARAIDAIPEKSIAEHLLITLNGFPKKPNKNRLNHAKKLGETLDHDQLSKLFLQCTSKSVWLSPIHGDLHAKNVLIRSTDAVVIDFFKSKVGPALYDPACMEAGLLADGFQGDKRNCTDWLNSIISLYDKPLFDATTHCPPKDPSYWYFSCVRQIRLHARHLELAKNQYAAALAFALLKKASKDLKKIDRYRAAAYFLAGRVLINAVGTTRPTLN